MTRLLGTWTRTTDILDYSELPCFAHSGLPIGDSAGKQAGHHDRGRPMMSEAAATSRLLHFSTDQLPETDRIGVWREVYGKLILRLDIEPLPDRSFEADVRLLSLPG